MKNLNQEELKNINAGGIFDGIIGVLEDWLFCGMGGDDDCNCPE